MFVSIVVPTFNRSQHLPLLIDALENQVFKNFELIVVDDGSSDNTQTVISELIRSSSLKIKSFVIANSGRAASRNSAVAHAKGELLIFYDDDIRPNPNSVQEHVNAHLNQLGSVIIGGPYLYDSNKFINAFNRYRSEREALWYPEIEGVYPVKSLRINGGNFSIKKSVIEELGGFDERLTDKEDFKLAYDACNKLGIKVFGFNPTWVYHDDYRDLMDYIKRGKETRIEEQKLKILEPSINEFEPLRFEIEAPKTVKSAILSFLFRRKPLIRAIQKIVNHFSIPKKFYFKLYDIIITYNVTYLK